MTCDIALEQGLGGVVLKTEDVEAVLELKEYFDKRNKEGSQLGLTKATITRVEMTGMGDRVCVDLCSLIKPSFLWLSAKDENALLILIPNSLSCRLDLLLEDYSLYIFK
ncbi:hypothetical protein L2E82_49511 [Cichorium intybus]|uniref:Uncharacterized protein n=1 Tax=Cichorium intybus TaxID=13427 RepID=A0ACB8Z0J8_CICIN|nr:hypothetical protein L2E82_49511 [Cichorium intybus]